MSFISAVNWRPNGTEDWLLIYTAEGAGCLTTASAKGHDLSRRSNALCARREWQDYIRQTLVAGPLGILLWAHFMAKPSWKPWLHWPVGPHGVKSLRLEKGEVQTVLSRPCGERCMLFAIADPILPLMRWRKRCCGATSPLSQGSTPNADARVRWVTNYLVAQSPATVSIWKCSRGTAGFPQTRLAHLFKAATGLSPQQFFEEQRMWHAGQLLRVTGLGIAEIADEVGYGDPFYFSNRFRRYAGKSPTAFREEKKAA